MRNAFIIIVTCSLSLFAHAQQALVDKSSKQKIASASQPSQSLPDNPAELKKAAAKFEKEGKIDSAILYLEKASLLDVKDITTQLKLGALYQMNEQYDEALEQYSQIIRQGGAQPHPAAFYGKARTHFAQKGYLEALRNSEIAMRWYLEANKNIAAAEARLLSGQCYMHMGMYQQAIKYFKASKKHYFDRPFYHYYIGYSYMKLNKIKQARQYLLDAEKMGYQVPTYVKMRIQS